MAGEPCLLLACREIAYNALVPILRGCFRVVHTRTLEKTLAYLERYTDVDVIVATVSFDESRMLNLLRAEKGQLSRDSVHRLSRAGYGVGEGLAGGRAHSVSGTRRGSVPRRNSLGHSLRR
jgi:hypothetical protein